MLEEMIQLSRTDSKGSRYERYQPVHADSIRKTSVRSLNLIILRLLCGSGVEASLLAPNEWDATEWWRSTVRLWSAGLAIDEWRSVLAILTLHEGRIEMGTRKNLSSISELEIAAAELQGDLETARVLRAGISALGGDL
jgi:hypothetical protein